MGFFFGPGREPWPRGGSAGIASNGKGEGRNEGVGTSAWVALTLTRETKAEWASRSFDKRSNHGAEWWKRGLARSPGRESAAMKWT